MSSSSTKWSGRSARASSDPPSRAALAARLHLKGKPQMLDLDALLNCFSATSCLVTQTSTGIIIGMLLFLVASGVTLIFGVLHVVNFAHGAFYMIGAYTAWSAYGATGSYYLAVLAGAVCAA